MSNKCDIEINDDFALLIDINRKPIFMYKFKGYSDSDKKEYRRGMYNTQTGILECKEKGTNCVINHNTDTVENRIYNGRFFLNLLSYAKSFDSNITEDNIREKYLISILKDGGVKLTNKEDGKTFYIK